MIEEILPHLYRIRVPLPGSPLQALNSYVIKATGRYLVIDTGWNREECRRTMLSALERLNVDLRQTDFFITHIHADHLGLVANLATNTSQVYFNAPEAAIINMARPETRWQKFGVIYHSHGFPESDLEKAMARHPNQLYNLKHSFGFRIVREGDTISSGDYSFRCIETPGHSPGHICLYEANKKILVSGDHILDTITPNIGFWLEIENPLKEYLASLDKVHPLDVAVVLPAHRNVFKDHRQRIAELKEHHRARTNQILAALDGAGKTAFQIAPYVKWDVDYPSWELFPPAQKWFALGETVSHLKYLEENKRVQRKTREQKTIFCLA